MINKVTLLGHVGQAPEIRETSGNKVANFTLATTEKYTKDGVKVENTEWHNIVIWGRMAETVASYVRKGSKLYLEGRIKTESYEKDGIKRYTTKIICNQMQMLDNKANNAAPPVEAAPEAKEDGLPF